MPRLTPAQKVTDAQLDVAMNFVEWRIQQLLGYIVRCPLVTYREACDAERTIDRWLHQALR